MLLVGGSPLGDLKAFKDGTGLSVETHITYTLEKSVGMEVLSVDVVHDIWLLVEFIAVNILNSQAGFTCLLDMELVGHSKDVRVRKLKSIGNVLFDATAGTEDKLNPAVHSTLMADVVFKRAADLTSASHSAVKELIGKRFLHWHVFDF